MSMNARGWAYATLKDLSAQNVDKQNLYKFVLFAVMQEEYKQELLKKVPESMRDEVIEVMKETVKSLG
jgi:hypothetical protein